MLYNQFKRIKLVPFAALALTLFASKGFAITPQKSKHTSSDTTKNGNFYFLLKSETGKTINVAQQKGKILFLNFWALSCIPCKAEMPSINELSLRFGNDTNVLIMPIDLDQDMVKSPRYMTEKGYRLTVYYAASQVPEAFFHGAIPTTVVIDKHGRIALFHEGQDDYGMKKFIDYIDELRKQ